MGDALDQFLSSDTHGDGQLAEFQQCCVKAQEREGQYFSETQRYQFSASRSFGTYQDSIVRLSMTCESSRDSCELRGSWEENLEPLYALQSCIDQYEENDFEVCPGSSSNVLEHGEL